MAVLLELKKIENHHELKSRYEQLVNSIFFYLIIWKNENMNDPKMSFKRPTKNHDEI